LYEVNEILTLEQNKASDRKEGLVQQRLIKQGGRKPQSKHPGRFAVFARTEKATGCRPPRFIAQPSDCAISSNPIIFRKTFHYPVLDNLNKIVNKHH